MNSSSLTPAQAGILYAQLTAHLRYFGRLKSRMEQKGFPTGDPLYANVLRAYNAIHAAAVQTHYLTIESGVAKSQ